MVRVNYSCDICGRPIASLSVDNVDEGKFGFDCLTAAERAIIIDDSNEDVMEVKSLCDDCAESFAARQIGSAAVIVAKPSLLH